MSVPVSCRRGDGRSGSGWVSESSKSSKSQAEAEGAPKRGQGMEGCRTSHLAALLGGPSSNEATSCIVGRDGERRRREAERRGHDRTAGNRHGRLPKRRSADNDQMQHFEIGRCTS